MSRINYELIRSDRKTLAIQVSLEGKVIVRAPRRMPIRKIEKLMLEKEDWILSHVERMEEAAKKAQEEADSSQNGLVPLTSEELKQLAQQACEILPPKVAHYASLMGVTYGRITVRNQTTRWGSCSAVGNLNFNCLLMLAPEHVQDYVVVHELSHRKEMNHSKAFWQQVERTMPDYKVAKKWLKEHGTEIMLRNPKR